jgi:hypothetical protein
MIYRCSEKLISRKTSKVSKKLGDLPPNIFLKVYRYLIDEKNNFTKNLRGFGNL